MRLPFLILILMVSAFSAADTVNLVDGNLSVEFTDTDLRDALKAVGAKAEVNFVVSSSVDGKLSSKINALPLEQAIKKLLYGYNYAVMYDDGSQSSRKINKVVVLGAASGNGRAARNARVSVAGQNSVEDIRPSDAALGQTSASQLTSERLLNLDGDEVIAEKNEDGKFLVKGSINGRGVTFILDNRTSKVTVSARMASNLGIVVRSSDTQEGSDGEPVKTYGTIIDSVKIGDIEREGVEGVIFQRMENENMPLLGRSFLQGLKLEILEDIAIISEN